MAVPKSEYRSRPALNDGPAQRAAGVDGSSSAPRESNSNHAGAASQGRSEASSHVRKSRDRRHERAIRRVTEYLHMVGLTDREQAFEFAYQCALRTSISDATDREPRAELAATEPPRATATPSVPGASASAYDADRHAQRAVREAQDRIARFKAEVFADFGGDPNPLWLRTVLSQRPELFLLPAAEARQVVADFGDARAGTFPATNHFKKQHLARPRVPRWLVGLVPVLAVTSLAVVLLGRTMQDGLAPLSLGWLSLYAFLLGNTVLGCWIALRGFWALVRDRSRAHAHQTHAHQTHAHQAKPSIGTRTPRVAIALPIYHEDAAQVFANLAAMRDSLREVDRAAQFEFFVLSDSQDPWFAADEERAFRRVATREGEIPVYYRRRARNERQKAGNIEEFFERWGSRYEYVIVLDADSLMQGPTMVELVKRMENSPRVGLLQTPIALVGGETLLCRALQWSTSVVGPLFTHGLAAWAGPHGNYYGHNAIIRTQAFLKCCALPVLQGSPPFGGSILSHDFVEAALLCRGGWQVRTATDLAGSYEGSPPTLMDYVARDRRWCQGNLQHLAVVGAPGLKGMSRLHLLIGAATYLAAPAWFLFLVLGVYLAHLGQLSAATAAPFLMLAGALLAIPRVLGLVAACADRSNRETHGGGWRLCLTLPLELLFSTLVAPLLLFHHAKIVVTILCGRVIGWGGQHRKSGRAWGRIVRTELFTTLFGISMALLATLHSPELLLWLSPVWLPLTGAIPIAALASSPRLGSLLRRCGVFLVPTETRVEPLLAHSEAYRSLTESDSAGRFRDLVLDPVLLETHLQRLDAQQAVSGSRATGPRLRTRGSDGALPLLPELCERALRLGPTGLDEAEHQILVRDPSSLRWLHREAWCHWPIEGWRVSGRQPQLPDLR